MPSLLPRIRAKAMPYRANLATIGDSAGARAMTPEQCAGAARIRIHPEVHVAKRGIHARQRERIGHLRQATPAPERVRTRAFPSSRAHVAARRRAGPRWAAPHSKAAIQPHLDLPYPALRVREIRGSRPDHESHSARSQRRSAQTPNCRRSTRERRDRARRHRASTRDCA